MSLRSVAEEIDVSGGTPLDKRDGLREAIEAVEAGRADVVIVGYFDRLFRSLVVQAEVVSRVESVGGEVLALDFGKVSEGSAAQWLSGTMMGAFAEYQRRSTKERTRAAQVAAVKRGVPPFPTIPPGLERGADKRLIPTVDAPAVLRAFEMRADGVTLQAIREYLAGEGVGLSYRGVQSLLRSPLVIGEIRFGDLVNQEAHEAIVPRELFNRVQRVKVSRGPSPQSDRLLARVGVLRCGSCDARMVVASSNHGKYPVYRCPPNGDCERHMAISAEIVEECVVEAVKEALANVEGRASVESNTRSAESRFETAQEKLDAAIRAFADFSDEPATEETLVALRAERDASLEALERLGGKGASLGLTGADWETLNLAERRDLIRGVVERIVVSPGLGRDRISVELFV